MSLGCVAGTMAGTTRAFDYRVPPPPWRNRGPAEPVPIMVYPYAARPDELPCPVESGVTWPATIRRGSHAWLPAPEATTWSPVYCVRIGASGHALAVRLAAGSGNSAADRQIADTISGIRFKPAGWHAPVTAWHRVVVILPGRPEGTNGTPHRGLELHLHLVRG